VRAQLRRASAALQRPDRTRGELVAATQAVEAVGRQVATKPTVGSTAVDIPTVQGGPHRENLAIGDRARVLSLNQEGQVTALLGDTVEVQVGNFKLRADARDLERASGPAPSTEATARYGGPSIWSFDQRPIPASQLDMRGWRAEQVVPELERYLNDAYMSGMPNVRIVHGKGTGVLRQVVRDYLASSKMVERFETADAREGGDGATIAYLAL